MWGKPHASETAFLQALANVTKVTFAFLKKRSAHEGAHESVQEGGTGTVEPDTLWAAQWDCTSAADLQYRLPPLPPTSQDVFPKLSLL